MDLRQLRSFVIVAQELSFRVATKQLGMSQPPLSRRIKALEEEVGVRLLERERNRRVTLTDAGQIFLADEIPPIRWTGKAQGLQKKPPVCPKPILPTTPRSARVLSISS